MLKMQRKSILSSVTLSVAAVFLVAGLAFAQGPGQGAGCKKGMQGQGGRGAGMAMAGDKDCGFDRLDRMAARLDLSEDQKIVIEKLHAENRELSLGLRADMMRLRNELQGEMMKDDPSEKTILGISAQITDIKGELQANRLKTKLAVRKQLTSEQRDMMLLAGGQGKGQKGGFHGKNGRNGKAGRIVARAAISREMGGNL